MREPFKDLKLTLRVRRDDEAVEADEKFKTAFDEYPSMVGFGNTADESLSNFGHMLSELVGTEMSVKNLKRAVQRHEAKRARRGMRRAGS